MVPAPRRIEEAAVEKICKKAMTPPPPVLEAPVLEEGEMADMVLEEGGIPSMADMIPDGVIPSMDMIPDGAIPEGADEEEGFNEFFIDMFVGPSIPSKPYKGLVLILVEICDHLYNRDMLNLFEASRDFFNHPRYACMPVCLYACMPVCSGVSRPCRGCCCCCSQDAGIGEVI